ncbi:PREDICTED: RILP-like protein 2 isoform X1 [Miniopterus natalensis]|uniref:RILP-like protein 2 isoform X1 n=1 Tax=Miniopterus natalensis TaxID=291302 RepID=UPI0007A6B13C|nr:PREDICTED: RILP-like protein 2 isoform X1 [Miniopterus natalensis]XP_016058680.1 PREDICTED: RILP-like protein 2 isoform X1 [Miniopterus natalensis]
MVVDLTDPNRPRFTLQELRDVLQERNKLKSQLLLAQEELQCYKSGLIPAREGPGGRRDKDTPMARASAAGRTKEEKTIIRKLASVSSSVPEGCWLCSPPGVVMSVKGADERKAPNELLPVHPEPQVHLPIGEADVDLRPRRFSDSRRQHTRKPAGATLCHADTPTALAHWLPLKADCGARR